MPTTPDRDDGWPHLSSRPSSRSLEPGPPRTLARATTSRGEVALRVREDAAGHPTYELIVGGVFAMDTVDVSTEVELARLALGRCPAPGRVLVGGLGLGFTAGAVLADPRVEALTVVEIEQPLIDWARAGLIPSLADVVADPRVRVLAGDVAEVLNDPERTLDVILLDVDNGPSFLVHRHNSALYADPALARAAGRLTPGGVLAIWAAQPEPELAARLRALADARGDLTVSEERREVRREGRTLTYAILLAARARR